MTDNKKEEQKVSVEELENMLVNYLDKLYTNLIEARDICKKIGFPHLAITLNTDVEIIRYYRKEYKESKKHVK